MMLDIEYSEPIVEYLTFSQDDILTNFVGDKLYDTITNPEDLDAKFMTEKFNFRSSYFMIQGLKISLKILVLPFFVLALFCCAF